MSATAQVIFERAVKHHLPTAFVTQLEKVDEFELGQTLVYHHKKWWQVFQKKELDYTGLPLESLLAEGELKSQFKVETEKTELFSDTSDQSNRTVDVDLDLDAEVKVAFIDLGGKVDGKGTKKVTLTVSLGAVNHIRSNIFQAMYGKGYTVDMNHPVVKDAIARGGSLFVISSIYISDKAEIKISESESGQADTKDSENTDTSTSATTGSTTTGSTTTGTTGTTTGTTGSTTTGTTATDTTTGTTSATASGVAGAVEDAIATVEDVVKKDITESGGAQVGGDVSTTGATVTNRDTATVIAFNVLKIDITKTGVLMPTDRSGFTSHHKVHYPYADTFFTTTTATNKEEESKDSGATSEGVATPKDSGATSEGGGTPKDGGATSESGATPKDGGATSKGDDTPKDGGATSEGGATPKEEDAPKDGDKEVATPKEDSETKDKEEGGASSES